MPWPERIADALRMSLLGPNATALAQHLGNLPLPGIRPVSPGQAAAVLAAYVALFVVLAGAIFRRRDIA